MGADVVGRSKGWGRGFFAPSATWQAGDAGACDAEGEGRVPSLRNSGGAGGVQSFAAAEGPSCLRLIEFRGDGRAPALVWVEAEISGALSRGMQLLCVRLAAGPESALYRTGQRFATTTTRSLATPRGGPGSSYFLTNADHHFGVTVRPVGKRSCFSGWTVVTATTPALRTLLLTPCSSLPDHLWSAPLPLPEGTAAWSATR